MTEKNIDPLATLLKEPPMPDPLETPQPIERKDPYEVEPKEADNLIVDLSLPEKQLAHLMASTLAANGQTYSIAREPGKIARFFQDRKGKPLPGHIVINLHSPPIKKAAQAEKFKTEEWIAPGTDLLEDVLKGRVVDNDGNEHKFIVPPGVRVIAYAERGIKGIKKKLEKAGLIHVKAMGYEYDVRELLVYSGETVKIEEPPISEQDTI